MSAPATQASALPDRRVLAAFLLFVVIGGGASLAIRVTYRELPPFWSATIRFALAAAILWAMVAIKKLPLPKGRALAGAVLFGTLTVGLAFVLIGWGLVKTPASTYQTLMALVPLLTVFLSAVHGLESITRRGIIGALLAVAGIAVTVGLGRGAVSLELPRILAILAAAVCIAEGGVLVKRFPRNPPIMTNAIGMTMGMIILAAASLLSGERWFVPTQASTWAALLYLIVLVTVAGFVLYLFVLEHWTASGASYGFVLFPLVTILLAALFFDEVITINFLVGAALVLAGVLVGALLPAPKKTEVIEECKDTAGEVLPRCM